MEAIEEAGVIEELLEAIEEAGVIEELLEEDEPFTTPYGGGCVLQWDAVMHD